MKFDVGRKEFLLMAKKTAKAALYGNPAKILEGIHIKANDRICTVQMTATNLQVAVRITIPADVSESGEAVLDSKLLVNIFEQLPEDEVHMELVNGVVIITSGRSVFQVAVIPGEFPKVSIPIPGDTVTVSSGGRVGVRLAADGIELLSLDENKPGGAVITASVSKPMDKPSFLISAILSIASGNYPVK